ncbi:hypothetical protein [Streptomyces pinistramenti]|uniref:hypothetical protein n=1 Tax=Streptomyces pinistramenti TaxID=2884812 RepID=UPI001D06289C|nr:hypothetical protein [Streptomyces pinistramenti]MCB5909326.1 hypothetical protein [Streptomyces pinistramenti]
MITTEDPGKWNVPNLALTRRTTLLAGAALGAAALVTGCSDDSGTPPPDRTPAADHLRAAAARDSTGLLARYDATLAAHPALQGRLRPLRSEVARHAEAFGTKSVPAAPSAPPGKSRPPVPKDEKAARTALAEAERHLADARTRTLRTAPPGLARLLASVAAAGTAHAYLLTEQA